MAGLLFQALAYMNDSTRGFRNEKEAYTAG
jgi:hypothetical protein